MSSVKENPCKNFSPNVFNKNKCLNCFKSRDTHLKSDKDLSKAKPIYGGWLLLAPIGTDFGNPAHKNRKWQRRWFVLFEHGALRYALDNSETTVAQGTVDMNKCNDLKYAEAITGQKHSLCIYLPDQNYFIRGECREDIMGWHDQLIVYPQTNKEEMKRKNRMYKRQNDIPKTQNTQTANECFAKSVNSPLLPRSRNSSSSSVRSPSSEKRDIFSKIIPKRNETDLILPATDESVGSEVKKHFTKNSENQFTNPSTLCNKLDTSYFTSEKKLTETTAKLQRNISISTSSIDSTASSHSLTESIDSSFVVNSRKKQSKDKKISEQSKQKRHPGQQHKDQRKDLDKRNRVRSPCRDENDHKRDRIRSAIDSAQVDTSNKENDEPNIVLSDWSHDDRNTSTNIATSPLATPRDSDREEKRGRAIVRRSTNMKQGTQSDHQPRSSAELRRAKSLDRSAYDPLHLSSDLFNIKKGWLQVQVGGSRWNKYWFVLAKKELNFYQDSSSEESSKPEGTIDLSDFVEVHELDVERNYGFEIQTMKNAFVLSAMTFGIRKNWINAIKKSCESQDLILEPPQARESAKDNETVKPKTPDEQVDVHKDSSSSERAARRKARIHGRKKEGRSRTIDFSEFKPSLSAAHGMDSEFTATEKLDKGSKSDGKARSRTLNTDALLMDTNRSTSTRKKLDEGGHQDDLDGSFSPNGELSPEIKTPPPLPRSSSSIRLSIENEWKKLEKAESMIDLSLSPSPITKTASMVRALQTEIDSLKKQMERVHNESLISTDGSSEDNKDLVGQELPKSDKIFDQLLDSKIDQQNAHIDKLKQELLVAQEAFRKQGSDLRNRDMQLDIAHSESQVLETRLSNLQNELLLEKSRREECENERDRKIHTLNKELENSESNLKKAESSQLDAQRKIRELERLVHMQKDHNKEEELLQGHIGILRRQVEEQESEMRDMQESFEERCQSQKKLEDDLSEARELIKNYEEELRDMRKALENTNRDVSQISSRRDADEAEIKRLNDELNQSRLKEKKLMENIEKLMAQSELDEECNESLEHQLNEEKATNLRLQNLIKEQESNSFINQKKLKEAMNTIQQLTKRFKDSTSENENLKIRCEELSGVNKKLKDGINNLNQSDQTIRDLRARLIVAEKQLGDIEEIRSKTTSTTEGSFAAKLSELEAEMGGTGQMIAARLQSLEPSRRVSDPSLSSDKESHSQKILRLEGELEKKTKELSTCEEELKSHVTKIQELESREKEAEKNFAAKLHEFKVAQDFASRECEEKTALSEATRKDAEKRLSTLQECLAVLHRRATEMHSSGDYEYGASQFQIILDDISNLSEGKARISESPPRSPSPTSNFSERRWSRVTDEESRQQHHRAMNRLRQLAERSKSADGKLVSPVGSSTAFQNQINTGGTEVTGSIAKPKDLKINYSLGENVSSQLFAKQIGVQALLLAEMAVTLRRSQSSSGLLPVGRNQGNYNSSNRQGSPSSQLSSANFSDNSVALSGLGNGSLLEHVDALAQKLTLEGMLMREISQLKESWLLNRGRSVGHRSLNPGTQQNSDLSTAMVTHAHVSYVLQVYNERISRLALEAKQSRHKADSAMRKLRELVQACKTKDLNAISNLAVQVDLDSIATPYSDKPQWEQQVDYGTLHGAHSVSSASTETTYLEQEAIFFQHLAEDLKCMSADVESLSKVGARLIQTDATLQKLLPSEIGEHASTIAREAIVQAEMIYISHKLRRDYDEELRKAKEAVSDQSNHLQGLQSKMKQVDENWNGKLKLVTEEHNAKVTRLVEEVERLERARAELSDDMEKRLTRLSKKHQQDMKSFDTKHEQEKMTLKNELTQAKNDLKANTNEYLAEVKNLKEKLEKIELQHRKEIDQAHKGYKNEIESLKSSYSEELKQARKAHEKEVGDLKAEFEKEFIDADKEFKEKIASIEDTKRREIQDLTDKQLNYEKQVDKEHDHAINEVERKWLSQCELLKREFDEFVQQEKRKHQLALKKARDDADAEALNKYKQKVNNIKQEHEKLMKHRDELHKEQLEREKESWVKKYRQQWESEREISRSISSEADNKEALKLRINVLEEQLNSVQNKLEDEQHRHEYNAQLNEIKSLCDQSFAAIEESHAKQLEELKASHKREMERVMEEHSTELDTNNEDTRRVIDAMRKHHVEELRKLREEVRSGSNWSEPVDVSKLNEELQKLSEQFTRKCVELKSALEQIDRSEDKLKSLERENQLLRSRKPSNMTSAGGEPELRKLSGSNEEDHVATDLYQLQVLLRVKTSEIDYLKQDVTSLNKQLDEACQEIKLLQRKHKDVFENLTISRSKEGMSRREVHRLKELLRRKGIDEEEDSDSDSCTDTRDDSPSGYDFQKSRSQPDFPSTPLRPTLSLTSQRQTSSSTASVKRRSSDRSTKYGQM